MFFPTSTGLHFQLQLLFTGLLQAISASPIDTSTSEMHFLRESKRQTLTQQTQEPGTATGGINNAGKIVTAIFVPIIGLIIIGCFYWVCLSDKVVEHFAKRKDIHTARREARMAKRGARNEGTVNGIEMQDRQRV